MEIYLPVAELAVSWPFLVGLGAAVGFLSGMLGVGGGFILTPLLIFIGIPPAIAVSTQATPIAASAIAGALGQSVRKAIDFKMGTVLLVGGTTGATVGVYIFGLLQRMGQIDFTISISYVVLLGFIGTAMLTESVRAIRNVRTGKFEPVHRPGQHNWIHALPFKVRFRQSRLYISVIPPLVIGFIIGIMTAIIGVGGAFLLIPAKIYILKMRTNRWDISISGGFCRGRDHSSPRHKRPYCGYRIRGFARRGRSRRRPVRKPFRQTAARRAIEGIAGPAHRRHRLASFRGARPATQRHLLCLDKIRPRIAQRWIFLEPVAPGWPGKK